MTSASTAAGDAARPSVGPSAGASAGLSAAAAAGSAVGAAAGSAVGAAAGSVVGPAAGASAGLTDGPSAGLSAGSSASPATPSPASPARAVRSTGDRVVDAAVVAFGTRGYDATSLDALARELGIRKQTILYYCPSKEALLDAAIDRGAAELSAALELALDGAGNGWERVEAIVRSVFRLAARRPELLGLLREVSRLGPPAATRLTTALGPLIGRAATFLEIEMEAGAMRQHDPRLLLLAAYSTVIGVATEVEVLRALGYEPTARSLVRRRRELLSFLRSALVPG